jgi:hypothetical protein
MITGTETSPQPQRRISDSRLAARRVGAYNCARLEMNTAFGRGRFPLAHDRNQRRVGQCDVRSCR